MHKHIIQIGMYLILTWSPQSSDDLLNYKGLDCLTNRVRGTVVGG